MTTSTNNRLINLGYCSSTHGVQGAVVFKLDNPATSLKIGMSVVLDKNQKSQKFIIQDIKIGNKVIVKLKQVQTPEQAKELVGCTLLVHRHDLPELSEDEYYLNDLIGLDIYDQTDKLVGQVVGLSSNGVQDIVIMMLNQQQIELPLVKHFFPTIDIEAKKVVVNLPEVIE
jgi:16S rRNA processing protein RimM